jgi:cysteine desulfuration protein SufE
MTANRLEFGPEIDAIIGDFALLEDWEDRYRYVIDLGRALAPLRDAERTDANKVRGCASQVWLVAEGHGSGPDRRYTLRGDSDAAIVKGLVAILLKLYSGATAAEIAQRDATVLFERLELNGHLSQQRSNGFFSMVQRIKALAPGTA